MCDKKTGDSFLAGTIVGAVLGVIAGIVLAPTSGKETRERIKSDPLYNQLEDELSTLSLKLKFAKEPLKTDILNKLKQIKEEFNAKTNRENVKKKMFKVSKN